MAITIQVSDDIWKCLIRMKEAGESFDDVLRKILKMKKSKEKMNAKSTKKLGGMHAKNNSFNIVANSNALAKNKEDRK